MPFVLCSWFSCSWRQRLVHVPHLHLHLRSHSISDSEPSVHPRSPFRRTQKVRFNSRRNGPYRRCIQEVNGGCIPGKFLHCFGIVISVCLSHEVSGWDPPPIILNFYWKVYRYRYRYGVSMLCYVMLCQICVCVYLWCTVCSMQVMSSVLVWYRYAYIMMKSQQELCSSQIDWLIQNLIQHKRALRRIVYCIIHNTQFPIQSLSLSLFMFKFTSISYM